MSRRFLRRTTDLGGSITVGNFVTLSPNSPSQNIVQATADVPDLTLRPFSDVQTSSVLRMQNAAGTVDTIQWSPSGSVIIQPDAANITALTLIGNVNDSSPYAQLDIRDGSNIPYFQADGLRG